MTRTDVPAFLPPTPALPRLAMLLLVLPLLAHCYDQRDDQRAMDDFLAGFHDNQKPSPKQTSTHSRLPVLMELLDYVRGTDTRNRKSPLGSSSSYPDDDDLSGSSVSSTSLRDLIRRYRLALGATSDVTGHKQSSTSLSQLTQMLRDHLLGSEVSGRRHDENGDNHQREESEALGGSKDMLEDGKGLLGDSQSQQLQPLRSSKRGIQGNFGASPPLYELCRMMGMPGCYK